MVWVSVYVADDTKPLFQVILWYPYGASISTFQQLYTRFTIYIDRFYLDFFSVFLLNDDPSEVCMIYIGQ